MLKRNWPQNPDKYEEQEKILKEREIEIWLFYSFTTIKKIAPIRHHLIFSSINFINPSAMVFCSFIFGWPGVFL